MERILITIIGIVSWSRGIKRRVIGFNAAGMADNSPAALKMRQRGKIWADGRPWAKDGKRHQVAWTVFNQMEKHWHRCSRWQLLLKALHLEIKTNTRFECH